MTNPVKIRKITIIEERLAQAHDAISAVLEDDDALREVTAYAFDPNNPERPIERPIEPEIRAIKATVEWAIGAARRQLRKLGAIDKP